MIEMLRKEWWVLAAWWIFAVLALTFHGLNFFDAVNGMALAVFWFVVLAYVVRALVLPFQYIRHSLALRRVLRREEEEIRRAEAGNPIAIIGLHIKSGSRDPRDVPWWHW